MNNSLNMKWLLFEFILASQVPPMKFDCVEKGWVEQSKATIGEMIKAKWGRGNFVALEFSQEPMRGVRPENRLDVLSGHFFYFGDHSEKHYGLTARELYLHRDSSSCFFTIQGVDEQGNDSNYGIPMISREGYAKACFQMARQKWQEEINEPISNSPGRPTEPIYDEADKIRESEPEITKKAAFVKAFKKHNSDSAWESMNESDKEEAIKRYIDARRTKRRAIKGNK